MSELLKNKMIMFYSPQGGAGKSTLAVNTAIFSALSGYSTLLVDMSMFGGIMASLKISHKGGYGLSSIITLLDLDNNATNTPKFNEVVKESIVKSGVNDNLDILISAKPVKMESINEEYAQIIVSILRDLDYQIVILDSSSELSERNMVFLEEADRVIIPVTQDISCGWKMVMFKEVMERYSLNSSKFKILVNKCSRYSGFNNREFESEIGYSLIGEIPLFEKNFQNYVNNNIQINIMHNRKAFKAFVKATKRILNVEGTGAIISGEMKTASQNKRMPHKKLLALTGFPSKRKGSVNKNELAKTEVINNERRKPSEKETS